MTLRVHHCLSLPTLVVWFPIRLKGAPAGDVYFELTFYAVVCVHGASKGRTVPVCDVHDDNVSTDSKFDAWSICAPQRACDLFFSGVTISGH